MKKILYILTAVSFALLSASCTQKDAIEAESIIKDSAIEQNDFDKWLELNMLRPYNIEFKYRFALNESDRGFYTVPASVEGAVIYAHLVKYLCIDSYDEVAGVHFTRGYFPKMFFLIGEWEYKNNGQFVLGTAEGGKKIMLAGVNYLPLVFQRLSGDELGEHINHYYIKTIHHEFTHILNQVKAYTDDFMNVTPSTYVSDAWSDTDNYYRGRGYITDYAQSEHREDFAELLSEYIVHSPEWWEAQLQQANSETAQVRKENPDAPNGREVIETKIEIVRNYMSESWGIDIDVLRDVIGRRLNDVEAGKVDLNTVAI